MSRILDLNPGDDIALVVKATSGKTLYAGVRKLGSGTEIHDTEKNPDLREFVKAEQRIRVTATRP